MRSSSFDARGRRQWRVVSFGMTWVDVGGSAGGWVGGVLTELQEVIDKRRESSPSEPAWDSHRCVRYREHSAACEERHSHLAVI